MHSILNIPHARQGKIHETIEARNRRSSSARFVVRNTLSCEGSILHNRIPHQLKYITGTSIFINTLYIFRCRVKRISAKLQKFNSIALPSMGTMWNFIWGPSEVSHEFRIDVTAFFSGQFLISMVFERSDFQKVISKVNLEIDYLESHSKNVRELIELVERGYEIRTKIPKDDFNFKSCQNIYNALQENASKLQQLVPLYTTKFKKEIFYRGVNLYDVN